MFTILIPNTYSNMPHHNCMFCDNRPDDIHRIEYKIKNILHVKYCCSRCAEEFVKTFQYLLSDF